MSLICGKMYARPTGELMKCQFLEHPLTSAHSWAEVADLDQSAPVVVHETDVQALMDAVARGTLDHVLEAILTTCHDRKRARRGTRGFGEDRRGA